MKAFINDLTTAVMEDRDKALPFLDTLKREREKVYRLLRHSFYGTFALMILARPLAACPRLCAPERPIWVGAFHAIIGSLVWGTLISAAFLVSLVLFRRREDKRVLAY